MGQSSPIPSPVGGLNTREGFTSLKPEEARVLQNWLPDMGGCRIRPGYTHFCLVGGGLTADSTGITADTNAYKADSTVTSFSLSSPVRTLATFKGASATKLVAACDGGLFDTTGATAVPIASILTYPSDYWVTESFNAYLFGVCVGNTPWRYDGTTLTATGFSGSGLTLTNLQTVSLVKGRLWFTEANSADVWYGGSASVTGSLTKFQLSQIAQGGKCIGIGAWSYEGGAGPNDQTVFMMSTGEIIIYSGDPATTFAKVGSYSAPMPVSINPFVKVGGELVILTVNGPIPISFIYRGVAFDLTELQIWGKIAPSWQSDYALASAYTGFFGHYFDGVLYLNVPLSSNSSKQYVLNTRVSAWTTYINLPISAMAEVSGTLYFGSASDAYVNAHGSGSDNGNQILALARQAFSFPMGRNKSVQWTMLRPNIDIDGSAAGQFQVDVDFNTSPLSVAPITLSAISSGAAWGAAWGSAWASDPVSIRQFISLNGYGCAAAPVVKVFSTADNVIWYSSDLVGVQGGIL
jgi:hypothetical protein